MKYKIIKCSDIETLEMLVNDYLHRGWTPYGSMSVTNCPKLGVVVFVQPMLIEQTEL